jgi:hypothetical protein
MPSVIVPTRVDAENSVTSAPGFCGTVAVQGQIRRAQDIHWRHQRVATHAGGPARRLGGEEPTVWGFHRAIDEPVEIVDRDEIG